MSRVVITDTTVLAVSALEDALEDVLYLRKFLENADDSWSSASSSSSTDDMGLYVILSTRTTQHSSHLSLSYTIFVKSHPFEYLLGTE
jgi:hypothetical protein